LISTADRNTDAGKAEVSAVRVAGAFALRVAIAAITKSHNYKGKTQNHQTR
jgi:hypothetical protein